MFRTDNALLGMVRDLKRTITTTKMNTSDIRETRVLHSVDLFSLLNANNNVTLTQTTSSDPNEKAPLVLHLVLMPMHAPLYCSLILTPAMNTVLV